jgi:hypothetical protein
LFVDFRHALGDEVINSINEKIVQLKTGIEEKRKKDSNRKQDDRPDVACDEQSSLESSRSSESSEQPAGINRISPETANNQSIELVIENRGTVIMDATCCPQDIAYPPSTTTFCPVMKAALSLNKNQTVSAISSVFPTLPTGCCAWRLVVPDAHFVEITREMGQIDVEYLFEISGKLVERSVSVIETACCMQGIE